MKDTERPDERRTKRYRRHLRNELQAAALYSALARIETDPERSRIFRELSDSEMDHAKVWASKVGIVTTPSAKLGVLGLLHVVLARVFGTRIVIPFLLWEEYGEIREYYTDPEAKDIAKDERGHERILKGLARGQTEPAALWEESRSATGASGNIRAAVLGVNDGLVSNLSLVMGVSGGTDNTGFVLLAGVAGLLAGAFSMAAGEYVSMRSQRDIYEHEIDTERIEIRDWPEEEQAVLSLIYQSKGLTKAEADLISRRVMGDAEAALDTVTREKLGLDPNELGAPWGAAIASFTAFVGGAIVPIIPFLFGAGNSAVVSAALSAVALMVVGGSLAVVSGNRPYWGALRMLLVGSAAAAVTYGIGTLVGVSVGELS